MQSLQVKTTVGPNKAHCHLKCIQNPMKDNFSGTKDGSHAGKQTEFFLNANSGY